MLALVVRRNKMTDVLLIQILNTLKRIADGVEKSNKLTLEKQKAELTGTFTKAEMEWIRQKAI